MTLSFREAPTMLTLNTMLYGPPKSGKTLGACSGPGPVALLNTDLPNASWMAHKRYGAKIMEVEFEGLRTLIDLVVTLRDDPVVNTVVVDPVADLHRLLMEEESNRAIRPSRDTYGNVAVHIERFCRELCRLPINAVIVCHETVQRDEETGGFERLPYTGTSNPNLGAKLMAMVDIIGYTGSVEGDDGTRTDAAQLMPGGGRRGGDRFSTLGPWQPLNIEAWLALIQADEPAQEEAHV